MICSFEKVQKEIEGLPGKDEDALEAMVEIIVLCVILETVMFGLSVIATVGVACNVTVVFVIDRVVNRVVGGG